MASTKSKIFGAGLGIELLAGGAMAYWPNIKIIAIIAIAIGGVMIFFPALQWLIGKMQNKETNQLIPLADAARQLYEDLRAYDHEHIHVLLASKSAKDDEDILRYFAIFIRMESEIYGCSPPSTKHERIPEAEFNRGMFVDGGNKYRYFQDHKIIYVDIRVNKNVLPEIYEKLKSENVIG